MPLSDHEFLKSILRFGSNQRGVLCITSLWQMISVLNKGSTLYKVRPERVIDYILDSVHYVGAKVKYVINIPESWDNSPISIYLLITFWPSQALQQDQFFWYCAIKTSIYYICFHYAFAELRWFVVPEKFLKSVLISLKRALFGLGRDRSKWVIFDKKSDFITVTLL